MAHIAKSDCHIEKLHWIYINDPASVFEIDGVKYWEEVSGKSSAELRTIEYARENLDHVGLHDYWRPARM